MCGRFTLTASPEQLQEAFPDFAVPGQMSARYNIAPTQPIAVVPNTGENRIDFFVWGLIPSWAKDPSIGNRLINARGETLGEKPSFRSAYRRRRCLVLSDGFFEWVAVPGEKAKQPHYITLEGGRPFAFAGLWEQWFSPDGSEIKSATIITTEPNSLVAKLHNRMPVILHPDDYARWIDPAERDPEGLQDLLAPYPASEMRHHPIARTVNSPANDLPEIIQPSSS
ncbi:MAG TPA: SOS response-associated peptidase [Anaerolineales bacterium]|nr:SOS response-associated peptidase [Anaerolineales bacterium]